MCTNREGRRALRLLETAGVVRPIGVPLRLDASGAVRPECCAMGKATSARRRAGGDGGAKGDGEAEGDGEAKSDGGEEAAIEEAGAAAASADTALAAASATASPAAGFSMAAVDEARRRLGTVWRLRRVEERRVLRESRVGLEQGSRKLLELRRAQLNERARALDGRVRARLVRDLTIVASHAHDLRGRGLQALRDRHRRGGFCVAELDV